MLCRVVMHDMPVGSVPNLMSPNGGGHTKESKVCIVDCWAAQGLSSRERNFQRMVTSSFMAPTCVGNKILDKVLPSVHSDAHAL
jgi:hypothetical protein